MKYTITIELTMNEPPGYHTTTPQDAELAEQSAVREMLIPFFCHQQGVYESRYLQSLQQLSESCMS